MYILSQWSSNILNNQNNKLPISYPSITNNGFIIIESYISSDDIAQVITEVKKGSNSSYYIAASWDGASLSNIISLGW